MSKTVDEAFSDPRVVALIRGAESADDEAVTRALESGADINKHGYMGMTPSHWLLAEKNYDGLRMLLDHGADPNQPMDRNWTLVWIAAGAHSKEVLAMILAHGGNPNTVDSSLDETPLMAAIAAGRLENADLLLENGADVNGHNNRGESAATVAILVGGRYDYALKLLEQGYSYDLPGMLDVAEMRQVPDEWEPKRQQVIQMLKQRLGGA